MPTPEEMQASINRIEADLAALRQTKGSGYLAGFPKWVVILFAVWVVAIETAEKLPQIMLSYPRYEATLAETQAKLMQPDLVRAQLVKAENEAKASALQPDMLKAQLDRAVSDATTARFTAEAAPNQPRMIAAQADKAVLDAEAAKLQPELMVAQLEKAKNDAKTSAIQPALTAMNLAKTVFETQAAVYQPKLNEVQLAKLGIETKTAVFQQGLTAANAVQAEQQTAMSNAALAVMAPMLGGMLKQFGIDLPMDKIAPMLGVMDPVARTRDLESAMPNGGAAPQRVTKTAAAAAPAVAPFKTATIGPDRTKIRGQPSQITDFIYNGEWIPAGSPVTIFETNGDWNRVSVKMPDGTYRNGYLSRYQMMNIH